MKNRLGFALLFVLGFVLGLVLMAGEARAQQPAPTGNQAAQSAKPDDAPYTVTSSIEVGVRGIAINGNADTYRSQLNYTPGFRLFDSNLVIKSKDGDGLVFDNLLVNTFGWDKDPNRYMRLNVEKNKVYRFDANYRRMDYFNSLRNLALNQHIADTEYRQGDFDLTLLPSNEKFKLNLGYSLNRNSGPSVITYDYQRDEFPILSPVRSSSDEYRVGFDAKLWVFDLSFQQGWRFFKDDTTYLINLPQAGNNTVNTSVINTFQRDVPTRGTTPFTRFSLHTFIGKRFDFTGRFIYSSGKTEYSLRETATGKDASGNNVTSDISTVLGNAKRPNAMGDIGATFFVTDRFRLSETFRVNSFRINGGDELLDTLLRTKTTAGGTTVLPPLITNTLAFRSIDYRRFLNQIDGDVDVSSRFSLHMGYRYTNRRVELAANDIIVGQSTPPFEPEQVDNHTDTFILGFKARPARIWSVYFDMEHGQSDNVFTRTANYDFTNFRVRSILRPSKTLAINASLVTKDNTNPSIGIDGQNFGADINTRIFTGSADWTPSGKFTLSSGYTHTHVTSEAEVIFFLTGSVKTSGISRYFMKDNFAFITAYCQLHPRVHLYGGYRIHKDPGQEDRLPATNVLISSYPYQFQSPEMRISVKLNNRMDWIAGYQYFDFKEKFINNQFYQAHLPYTSIRFYFGRHE